MSNRNILLAAAGASTGNPNAWDISKAYYDPGADAGNVSKAIYSGIAFSVSAQDSTPRAVFFKPDGTKMYVYGAAGKDVNEYDLSTPWLVSSASYVQNYSFAGETQPGGLFFKHDGTKMYLIGQSIDRVDEFSLSTPWDVSTASSSEDFSVSAQDTNPEDVFFKPDGTKMYVVGGAGVDINEYDLSTAWDVSSASYVQNFSVSTNAPAPTSVSFLSDGTKMYVLSSLTNDEVVEYSLSTPWDVSSASYVQSFLVGSQETDPEGMFMKPDGSIFFVCGNTSDIVYQYTIGGFSVAAQEGSPQGIFFKPDGTKMYIVGLGGDAVYEYNLSTDWDITTASYLQNFSVSGQEANPSDLFFKDDGTKMYIIGTAGDDVNEYSLSVAWDISSASYTTNFSVASQELGPNALFFKPDGTKMYIVGQGNDTIYQYGLSTAWDISSASYDSVSFSIAAQDGTPNGLSFKPDGTKMYVLGNTGDDVNEYNLSSAWDISTATFVQNTGVVDSSPSGLFWRDNGEEFFVVGTVSKRVQKYPISST